MLIGGGVRVACRWSWSGGGRRGRRGGLRPGRQGQCGERGDAAAGAPTPDGSTESHPDPFNYVEGQRRSQAADRNGTTGIAVLAHGGRSEEHTCELQSPR